MRAWIYWLLTFAVALTSGVYVYLYLDALQDTVPVVVASHDIGAYQLLGGQDVDVVQVSRRDRHEAALVQVEGAVGARTLEPVYAGEQLLGPRLSKDGGGLGASLTGAARIMFLPVGPGEAVGGEIERGDLVDVYHFSEAGSDWGEARQLLGGVRVLQAIREESARSDEGEFTGVLVEVSPEEAALLVFALETGTLYLVMSSPEAPPIQVEPVSPASFNLASGVSTTVIERGSPGGNP